ncbi:unnamed protein product [Acidocella sp. C78]|nr:unnamed protein product [Acidocella sp. C78]
MTPDSSNRIAITADDEDAPETETPETETPDTGRAAKGGELENRLFKQRKVLIFGEIHDRIARAVTGQLLALAGASDAPIDVFVNSPGGHVESGDTIHDVIRFVDATAPVRIIGTGWVASAGALIYLAGHKDRRFCLPNTRFLLHQPMAACAARPPISTSRPARSSRCASGSTASSPAKPGRTTPASRRTPTAITGWVPTRRSPTAWSAASCKR